MGDDKNQKDLELWTIEECGEWLRVSPEALRCRLKRGQFPPGTYVHLGRAVRFVSARVKDWILRKAAA
jgi:predicted DNA-binding transcriptional regulator AlpA